MNYFTIIMNTLIMFTPIIGMLLIWVWLKKYFIWWKRLTISFAVLWIYIIIGSFLSAWIWDSSSLNNPIISNNIWLFLFISTWIILMFLPLFFFIYSIHWIINTIYKIYTKQAEKLNKNDTRILIFGITLSITSLTYIIIKILNN